MRISRVKITNFANFSELDLQTGESVVVVGENRVLVISMQKVTLSKSLI